MSDIPLASYSHRAKPYAQDAAFRVFADRIAIEHRGRWNDFLFRDLVMIRLTFRPKNTTNEGYQTTLYRRDRRTAFLTNLSWKSLVDLERQDEAYSRFIETLITAAHEANPAIVLQAGMPRWRHIITAVVAILALVAMGMVTAQAVLNNGWPVAALTLALALYFGWWSKGYLMRNRPRRFSADAIPVEVMPTGAVGNRQ